MSVPTGKRSENKLQALADLTNAVEYLTRLCDNEKCFPKKVRWNLCSRLMDDGLLALADARKANLINVKTRYQAETRLSFQDSALSHIEAIWSTLDIAVRVYPIPMEKVHHMSELLLQAENSMKSWHRADAKRYSAFFEEE